MGDGARLSVKKAMHMLVCAEWARFKARQAGWHRRKLYFLSQQNDERGRDFFINIRCANPIYRKEKQP